MILYFLMLLTIWYYECEFGKAYASKVQSENDVVRRWNEYMKDILIMEKDP